MTDPMPSTPRFTLPDRDSVQIGVCYYHEYSPSPRLESDLDLMVSAGIGLIRIGESVWAKWEPREGEFDPTWLDEVIAAARDRSIDVVVGTPTYAIPAWMAKKYPEVMAHRATGTPIPYGRRQNVDYSNPTFRYFAGRIAERIARHYAGEPAIVGYQIDNEPGVELLYNPAVFDRFVEFLQTRFGTVDEVNRAWGLVYWSQSLADWSELWRPDGNVNPGYNLAWREFQTILTSDYLAWQSDIVRPHLRDDQYLMTCLSLGARPGLDPRPVARAFDVTAANSYYQMGEALTQPPITLHPEEVGLRPDVGPWFPSYEADLARGIARGPWLLTEATSGPLGFHHGNYPAYDGQWRQAAWLFVSRGARLVQYWQWVTPHYGVEAHWGGILGHDLEPGRCLAEIGEITKEFAAAGERAVDVRPHADVAILSSIRSRWALELQPPFLVPGTSEPDPDSYDRALHSVYKACFDSNRGVDIVQEEDLVAAPAEYARTHPRLIVPLLFAASDATLEALAAYAEAGGHLVVTFRTGVADEHGTMRHEVLPGPLRAAAGVRYHEFANALSVPLAAGDVPEFAPGADAHGTLWADYLITETAEVLARFAGAFGDYPAITTNSHGAGRVTTLGTLPDPHTMRALLDWIDPHPAAAAWGSVAPSVTVSSATSRAGQRLWFLSNWSSTETTLTAPVELENIVTGDEVAAGQTVPLGPWDVIVLGER